jgi:hypothetical protein
VGVLPKSILTPSFIEIALAVTKRALLTDDEDGRHIIAIAHLNNGEGIVQNTSGSIGVDKSFII